MYDDDFAWRETFRTIPKSWIIGAVAVVLGWRAVKLVLSMNRRLLTIEAMLLDDRPRGPLGGL